MYDRVQNFLEKNFKIFKILKLILECNVQKIVARQVSTKLKKKFSNFDHIIQKNHNSQNFMNSKSILNRFLDLKLKKILRSKFILKIDETDLHNLTVLILENFDSKIEYG